MTKTELLHQPNKIYEIYRKVRDPITEKLIEVFLPLVILHQSSLSKENPLSTEPITPESFSQFLDDNYSHLMQQYEENSNSLNTLPLIAAGHHLFSDPDIKIEIAKAGLEIVKHEINLWLSGLGVSIFGNGIPSLLLRLGNHFGITNITGWFLSREVYTSTVGVHMFDAQTELKKAYLRFGNLINQKLPQQFEQLPKNIQLINPEALAVLSKFKHLEIQWGWGPIAMSTLALLATAKDGTEILSILLGASLLALPQIVTNLRTKQRSHPETSLSTLMSNVHSKNTLTFTTLIQQFLFHADIPALAIFLNLIGARINTNVKQVNQTENGIPTLQQTITTITQLNQTIDSLTSSGVPLSIDQFTTITVKALAVSAVKCLQVAQLTKPDNSLTLEQVNNFVIQPANQVAKQLEETLQARQEELETTERLLTVTREAIAAKKEAIAAKQEAIAAKQEAIAAKKEAIAAKQVIQINELPSLSDATKKRYKELIEKANGDPNSLTPEELEFVKKTRATITALIKYLTSIKQQLGQ